MHLWRVTDLTLQSSTKVECLAAAACGCHRLVAVSSPNSPSSTWGINKKNPDCPVVIHLSAPVAVSLTARLLSSSMGPRRLTASLWRKPGMVWLCCTPREMLAHANSRTSALGLCNYRKTHQLNCNSPSLQHPEQHFPDKTNELFKRKKEKGQSLWTGDHKTIILL